MSTGNPELDSLIAKQQKAAKKQKESFEYEQRYEVQGTKVVKIITTYEPDPHNKGQMRARCASSVYVGRTNKKGMSKEAVRHLTDLAKKPPIRVKNLDDLKKKKEA